jgi:hypothetical protein
MGLISKVVAPTSAATAGKEHSSSYYRAESLPRLFFRRIGCRFNYKSIRFAKNPNTQEIIDE